MKAFVNRVIFCSLLLLTSIASGNASANTLPLMGDVNGDGVVDVADAVGIVNYTIGKPSTPFYFDAADMDGDGVVDIADAVSIINMVVGKNKVVAVDTIKVLYQNDKVSIDGCFDEDKLQASVTGTKVLMTSSGKQPFVCLVGGKCDDGSLTIDADTTCTVILNSLQLTSQESAAISFPKKQKANIELQKGTQNILCDATFRGEKDGTNACLYSKGTLSFTGKGTLSVSGNYLHGIACSKNISVEGCHIVIADVVKNGIHCDKFTLKKGLVDLHLQNDASKGIKAKEELVVRGGTIEGEATGGITNDNGDLSYCSLLKSDGSMTMSDGSLTLKQYGKGGRCISVDKDMRVTAGTINLECHSDGGQYLNTNGEQDYYTPKCITVDDSLYIIGANIHCLSTGLGGKGIVAGKYISIGSQEHAEGQEPPVIRVETQGECIINDEDEDQRFGCPKGIKCDSLFVIYDGDIAVSTAGMGGEGLESNHVLYIYGGSLECHTFDDGINVADSIEIAGGLVYCNADNNDGIDSNGSIRISGGIVASVNQNRPNESFDSEGGRFYLAGGTVFGIGSGPVDVKESVYPCYTTTYDSEDFIRSQGLILTEGKHVYVEKNGEVVMALRNDNKAFRTFLTLMLPSFVENEHYVISEGDCPVNAQRSYFNGCLLLNGQPRNARQVLDIYVQTKQ